MGKKLYVGNLSYDVDSSALEQLFAAHGTVESAQIITILCGDGFTTIQDGNPHLHLNGDFTCFNIGDTIQLVTADGTSWFEVSRSQP